MMVVKKSSKTNTLADGLIERTSSMLEKSKSLSIKMKKATDRGKRSKKLSEVKPVENISKNPQSFLEINPVQKEVLPSHKLQEHVYQYQNPFGLKEDSLSQRNCQSQLSHPSLSHIERECQESLIQEKIHIQQNRTKASNIRKAKL